MNAWMYLTKHMRKAGHFSGSHSRKNASACLSISFLQNEMRVSEGARLKHMQVLVHPREELFCPKDKSREGSSFSPISTAKARPFPPFFTFLLCQKLLHSLHDIGLIQSELHHELGHGAGITEYILKSDAANRRGIFLRQH